MLKHWRTSLGGAVCILFGLVLIYENVTQHYYNLNSLGMMFQSLHYWAAPLGLVALGIGLLHAADHKNLPK